MTGRRQSLSVTTAQLPVLGAPLSRRLQRFLRSPKGYLLLALVALLSVAAPSTGGVAAARTVLAAVGGAALLELACVRLRAGACKVPSSAVLSGLIVAFVLSAQEPWYAAAAAGVLATASKHLLRLGRGHLLNPAATGLLAVYFLFHSGQSWWGSLPSLPAVACVAVAATGWVVAGRANKLPAMLAFLGVYAGLCTGASLAGHDAAVAELFRPPFLNMALFLACFMVTDPPTSPIPFPEQVVYGATVALVSVATYLATHGLYYLIAGLLVANLGYAAWQFARTARRRPARSPAETFVLVTDAGRIGAAGLAAVAGALVLLLAIGQSLGSRDDASATTAGTQPVAAAAAPLSQSVATVPQSVATAPPPPLAAQAAATAPPSAANGTRALSFQDRFTGSVSQAQGSDGTNLDFDLTGSGQRAVRLTIHLVLVRAGPGRNRVLANQATLFDDHGAALCQGQVRQLDDEGFSIVCAGSNDATQQVELAGTITGGTTTRVEGELQAAPLEQPLAPAGEH